MRLIKKNRIETIDTFRSTYQAFLESNMSARAFCRWIGIKESHFYYWQAKIRKEAAHRNGEFLPVSINNHVGEGRPHRRTRDKLDENGSSCLRNRLSQRRDCPPVWRGLRTDARPADNDRAIADV